MPVLPGQRRQQFETDFITATRGLTIDSVKKALSQEILSAHFFEKSKGALATRYAKGKMSLGGSLEAQAFRRMDIHAFAQAIRDASVGALSKQGKAS